MNRQLQPELLDELPPNDPRAIHSRRDLRRLNAIMRNAHYLQNFLVKGGTPLSERSRSAQSGPSFVRSTSRTTEKITLLEIGAGDGNIAFQLARALSRQQISGSLLLLDRQPIINESPNIPGWTHEIIQADLFDWLPSAPQIDITIANLFLHHFQDSQLQTLFNSLSQITKIFAACEPRRNKFAPFFARNVWLIGCNQVTCHDAEISVRAGFRDQELSALWPSDKVGPGVLIGPPTASKRSNQPAAPIQNKSLPLPLGPPFASANDVSGELTCGGLGKPLGRGEGPTQRTSETHRPWRLTEHRAGLFTHFFAAVRIE